MLYLNYRNNNVIKEINKIVKFTFCEIKTIYAAMINCSIASKLIIHSQRENNTEQVKFILFLVEQSSYYSNCQFWNSLFNLYECYSGGHKSFFDQLKNQLKQINLNFNKKYFEKPYYDNVKYHYVNGMKARIVPNGFSLFLHPINVPSKRNNETAHLNISDKYLNRLKQQYKNHIGIYTVLDKYLIFDKMWKNFRCILRKIQQNQKSKINFDEYINWKYKPITKLDKFIDWYVKIYRNFLKGIKTK